MQNNGLTLKIVKNMSDQLWVDVPISLISHTAEEVSGSAQGALVSTIEIEKATLGSRIDLLFSPLFDETPGEDAAH